MILSDIYLSILFLTICHPPPIGWGTAAVRKFACGVWLIIHWIFKLLNITNHYNIILYKLFVVYDVIIWCTIYLLLLQSLKYNPSHTHTHTHIYKRTYIHTHIHIYLCAHTTFFWLPSFVALTYSMSRHVNALPPKVANQYYHSQSVFRCTSCPSGWCTKALCSMCHACSSHCLPISV